MSTTRSLDRCVLRHKYGARNVSRIYKKRRKQRVLLDLKREERRLKQEARIEKKARPSLWTRIKRKLKEWWG